MHRSLPNYAAPQLFTRMYLIFAVLLCAVAALLWFSQTTSHQIRVLNQEWQQYGHSAQQKYKLLNDMRATFGYTGFIHHFKNYVIRRDPTYLLAAQSDMSAAQAALQHFRSLPMSNNEAEAVKRFKLVIDNYQRKLDAIDHKQAAQLSVSELDQQVRIDDAPAARSLEVLTQVLDAAYVQTSNNTSQLLQLADRRLQLLSWFGIPMLILLCAYCVYLVFRATHAKADLESLFTMIPDGFLVANTQGQIIRSNPRASDIFGFTAAELSGMTIEDLVDPEFAQQHAQLRESFGKTTQHRRMAPGNNSFVGVNKFGEKIPLDIAIASLPMSGEAHTIAMVRCKKTELELKRQSETDYLTGTYNRMGIDRLLIAELERSKRYDHSLSLILIDIDHFKRVNDQLGHLAGDAIITVVAELLKKESRPSDIVGRWGGDEFCILCPETCARDARGLAQRLQDKLAQSNAIKPLTKMTVTLSIGIAEFDSNRANTLEKIFASADQALYRSKQRGRDCITLDSEHSASDQSR